MCQSWTSHSVKAEQPIVSKLNNPLWLNHTSSDEPHSGFDLDDDWWLLWRYNWWNDCSTTQASPLLQRELAVVLERENHNPQVEQLNYSELTSMVALNCHPWLLWPDVSFSKASWVDMSMIFLLPWAKTKLKPMFRGYNHGSILIILILTTKMPPPLKKQAFLRMIKKCCLSWFVTFYLLRIKGSLTRKHFAHDDLNSWQQIWLRVKRCVLLLLLLTWIVAKQK